MALCIVVPSWNGLGLLRSLCAGLFQCDLGPDAQIIVVDNGSTDGTADAVRALEVVTEGTLRCVELPQNVGFAGAVNAGLAECPPGADVVILNNDVVINDPELFTTLRRVAAQTPGLGIVSPVILSADGTVQAHGAGHLPFSQLGKTWCAGERWVNQFPGVRRCEVVPFVCALVTAPCRAAVGGLDERYFAYFEDSDYCLRAKQAGFGVASTSEAAVVHLGPETTARRLTAPGELYRSSAAIFRQRWGAWLDSRYTADVVCVSDLAPTTGYGGWSRWAMRALLDAGVRTFHQSARVSPDREGPSPDLWTRDCQGRIGDRNMAQIIIEHGARFCRNSGRLRFGWTMSDVDPWPASWLEGLRWVDELWVPTECDRRRVQKSGANVPTFVVPLGVDPGYFHPGIAPWPGRPAVDFLFVSNFQWSIRKNPDLLIQAFRDEFKETEPVGLYIKTGVPKPDELLVYQTRWWHRQRGAPVWIRQDPVPDHELGGLYTQADCFVLPTSGEGFCLPALEALACGLPVIVTGWGPVAEVLSDEAGRPLPGVAFLGHKVREVRSDVPVYAGCRWAVPSYADLRRQLRLVYTERTQLRDAAASSSALVRSQKTWSTTALAILERLEARAVAA